jgi:5'(3')-deoxyribonucleotidase
MIDPVSVGFDIDGVIADTMSLFLDIAHEEYNINGIRYEDITCYNLADCLDLNPEIIDLVVTRILDGDYAASLKPIAGAPEVLTRLARYYNPVVFITARPYLGPLLDWFFNVLSLSPTLIDMVATGTHERKADLLLERNISCFVEDRLETCYALQNVGILPILFKQPWNRKPHPFLEVGTWRELEALIEF